METESEKNNSEGWKGWKRFCHDQGFSLFGATKAEIPPQDKDHFQEWIRKEMFGDMSWFPDRQEIRAEFSHLGFSANTAIVLGLLYNSPQTEEAHSKLPYLVSKYALGEDYHKVIRNKSKPILKSLKIRYPKYKFRLGVDSLPISEKVLAREAGLGWIGKNTNLIHPELGSFFFLSVILTDYPWEEWKKEMGETTHTISDHCGSCKKCMEACPTGALFEPYKIDARKCISYLTIEKRPGRESAEDGLPRGSWVYGCDICQDVCPWNSKASRTNKSFSKEKAFIPHTFWKDSEPFQIQSQEEFNRLFTSSPIYRIGFEKWKENISRAEKKKI